MTLLALPKQFGGAVDVLIRETFPASCRSSTTHFLDVQFETPAAYGAPFSSLDTAWNCRPLMAFGAFP
jgi:hypothetical protein